MTRLALAQRARLVGDLADRGITCECVVIGDDENLDIAAAHGFHIVEQSNEFLGRKFNDGIEYACQHGADHVVTIGSDDWVHADLFDRLPLPIPPPAELVPADDGPVFYTPGAVEVLTGRNITLVDLVTGRSKLCVSRGSYGVIPWVIPREALEPSGFRPVREKQKRGIDGSLIAGLGVKPEWVFTDPHDVCRVDFKSDTNLNTYASITGAIGEGGENHNPWALLAEHYPPDLVALALQTHMEITA